MAYPNSCTLYKLLDLLELQKNTRSAFVHLERECNAYAFGIPKDPAIDVECLVLNSFDSGDLVVSLIAHSHGKRLETFGSVADLIEVAIELIFKLIVRRIGLELVALALLLALSDLPRCLVAVVPAQKLLVFVSAPVP